MRRRQPGISPEKIAMVEVVTIAAIAGAVTGGGAAIACACDLRIATQSARFGFPVARTLGNCLSMANYARLASLLGPARVKDIIFTARLVEAEEGHRVGLYNELVADHAALMARVKELAETIRGHAPLTMRATKEALRRLTAAASTDIDGDDLVTLCYTSTDFREGMEAFLGQMSETIGFIGLGLMGAGFCKRLIATGRSVVGYDLDPARQDEAQALGVALAASPAEVAERANRVCIAVTTPKAGQAVVGGDGGILPAKTPPG
eukprot:gene26938-34797_t